MKLPTLTAITLTAALAAVPAFAQNTQPPQPGKSAGTSTMAATDTNANNPAASHAPGIFKRSRIWSNTTAPRPCSKMLTRW